MQDNTQPAQQAAVDAPVAAKLPTPDEIRAIARSVGTSASDSPSPSEYVIAGYRAALSAQAAPVAVGEREAFERHYIAESKRLVPAIKDFTHEEARNALMLPTGDDYGIESASAGWKFWQARAALAATPAAVAPVVLPEPDAVLLNQGVELLHALAGDERNRGNCSLSEGATASAYAVQRLAAALLAGVSAPAGTVPEGWKWMTLPSRNDGKPLPVFLFVEHGVTYYQVFDTDSTAFEWELRSEEWQEVAPQQADARDAAPAASEQDAMQQVRQAVRDYHFALDKRTHGGVAAGAAMNAVEMALNMYWQQGQEADRRAAIAAQAANGGDKQ